MHILGRSSFWMRAAYFAFYAGVASWSPYLVLYYQHLSLSGTQIGILNALPPLGMALLAPIWGMVADSRGVHRLIIRIALLTTACVAVLLVGATRFWQVLPLILLIALMGGAISPILDSYGVSISAQHGLSFGQVRVWGSIGYTLVVWVIGYVMGGTISSLFLISYAAALGVTFAATWGLPVLGQRQPQRRWQGAAAMLRRPDMRVMLLVVFLLSIGTNPVFSLFGIYIINLGGTTTLLGATSALAALSEFPILFLGRWFTTRWGSRRMLITAIVIYALRIFLYSVVPSPSWVLPIQILHGCSFGMYLMASVTMVHELVGAEHAATAQGLLASAMAFGQMSGSLAGGILLDHIGVLALYRLSTTITVLSLLVFVVGMRWYGSPATHGSTVVVEQQSKT